MFKKEDTVYLSNKMTDLEDNGSYWFNVKEALLRHEYGCNVINPVIHTPPVLTYEQYMIIDEGLIKASTHVYMGDMWSGSQGAIQEHKCAYEYGKIVKYEREPSTFREKMLLLHANVSAFHSRIVNIPLNTYVLYMLKRFLSKGIAK